MKIDKMEVGYKKTNDWINQTEHGIIDKDGDISDNIEWTVFVLLFTETYNGRLCWDESFGYLWDRDWQ